MNIGKWRDYWLSYFLLLLFGLVVVEMRVGPIGLNGRFVERVPSLAAAFNWIFRPEQMRYVAVSDLKRNHHLQREDFTFHPELDNALYVYLPEPEDIVDQYLTSDVAGGQPLLPKNLSRGPVIRPDSRSYIVAMRLDLQPSSAKFFEPESKIVLVPANSTEKLEGTVVSGRWDKPVAATPVEAARKKPEPSPQRSPPEAATATPPK